MRRDHLNDNVGIEVFDVDDGVFDIDDILDIAFMIAGVMGVEKTPAALVDRATAVQKRRLEHASALEGQGLQVHPSDANGMALVDHVRAVKAPRSRDA